MSWLQFIALCMLLGISNIHFSSTYSISICASASNYTYIAMSNSFEIAIFNSHHMACSTSHAQQALGLGLVILQLPSQDVICTTHTSSKCTQLQQECRYLTYHSHLCYYLTYIVSTQVVVILSAHERRYFSFLIDV
jgi:hypothetical protein